MPSIETTGLVMATVPWRFKRLIETIKTASEEGISNFTVLFCGGFRLISVDEYVTYVERISEILPSDSENAVCLGSIQVDPKGPTGNMLRYKAGLNLAKNCGLDTILTLDDDLCVAPAYFEETLAHLNRLPEAEALCWAGWVKHGRYIGYDGPRDSAALYGSDTIIEYPTSSSMALRTDFLREYLGSDIYKTAMEVTSKIGFPDDEVGISVFCAERQGALLIRPQGPAALVEDPVLCHDKRCLYSKANHEKRTAVRRAMAERFPFWEDPVRLNQEKE